MLRRRTRDAPATPVRPGGAAPIRVLLVDDQQLVRAGLQALLSVPPDIRVVGQAATAAEAVAACERDRPDVLLVDTFLPGASAFSLIRQVGARFPRTRMIALAECDARRCGLQHPATFRAAPCWLTSMSPASHEDCLELALAAGAHGTLRKTRSPEVLVRAIRAVARGERWVDRRPEAQPTRRRRGARVLPVDPTRYEGLTRREVEVVRELLAGRANKEIGRVLGIREQTVKNAVSRILAKLRLQDRVQIALHAVDTGLLERYDALLSG